MNLSRQDRKIINNFSKINLNLEFKKDLRTMDNNRGVFAEYTLDSNEFKPFVIYDTKEFLSVLNLYQYPKLEISDKHITLKERDFKTSYHLAERDICFIPKEKQTIKEIIKDDIPDTSFELNFEDTKWIEKIKNNFRNYPSIVFRNSEDNFNEIVLKDTKSFKWNKEKEVLEDVSNEFIYTTHFKTNKNYNCQSNLFRHYEILISNYKVSLYEYKCVLFESLDIPLKYLFALEPKPKPDSKKESKSNA
jgi:hypothetical protein